MNTHPSKTIFSLFLLAGIVAIIVFFPEVAQAAGDGNDFSATLQKGWFWAYLASFGAGVLTSLTPCVYPMIPITVAIFGSKDEDVSRKKSFALAACYVGGMGLLFAVLGVSFAMVGGQAGTLLANPWVVIPIALLLVALAASLFGAFELRLPSALQNRLSTVGGKGYGGAFGMGLVGGLVAAPCTGPFLTGMLLWVASEGNPVLGGTMLFTYAVGVGVLFFVLAVTSMSVPKSGAWMEAIKSFGGIGLLATAVHFLRPVWPAIDETSARFAELVGGNPTLLLGVGVLVTIVGLVMGAIHLNFYGSGATKTRKAIGIFLTVAGLTFAISGYLMPERKLQWVYDEDTAFADAKLADKGVMIDFGAAWCIPCIAIEKVFGEPEIYDLVSDSFVPLKFDVTDDNEVNRELQERYKTSLPDVIFLDADRNELMRYRNKSPTVDNMQEAIEKAKVALQK